MITKIKPLEWRGTVILRADTAVGLAKIKLDKEGFYLLSTYSSLSQKFDTLEEAKAKAFEWHCEMIKNFIV